MLVVTKEIQAARSLAAINSDFPSQPAKHAASGRASLQGGGLSSCQSQRALNSQRSDVCACAHL